MKTLRKIGMAVLAVVLCMSFVACGDDDETPVSTGNSIIGTWTQSGDDDIMVISADGTLTWYDTEEEYLHNIDDGIEKWKLEGDWFTIYNDHEIINNCKLQEETDNMKLWRDYSVQEYPGVENLYPNKDNFGKYRMWTWKRYNR